MKTLCPSFEDAILEQLRGLDVAVPVFGLFETAANGELKQEDLTALQVRVYGMQQPNEKHDIVSCTAEIRLYVEQAESPTGELFFNAYEAVAGWLQQIMVDDGCTALDNDAADCDGLQVTGGDADYEISGGEWFAVWTLTLSGRLKQ